MRFRCFVDFLKSVGVYRYKIAGKLAITRNFLNLLSTSVIISSLSDTTPSLFGIHP